MRRPINRAKRCRECEGNLVVVIRGDAELAACQKAGQRLLNSPDWADNGGRRKHVVECKCQVPEPVPASAPGEPAETKDFDWLEGVAVE